MHQNQLLTAKETADHLRVHLKTVYQLVGDGKFPFAGREEE